MIRALTDTAICFLVILFSISCTKIEYNNPLDPEGTAYKEEDNDKTPPEITLKGSSPMLLLKSRDVYVEPYAEAVDNVDGDISYRINISGSVNTDSAGVYEIVYTVEDESGNAASKTRTVKVVEDSEPPVITLTGSDTITIGRDDQYNDPGAEAVDSVDGNLAVISSGTVDPSVPGTYTITYTASDRSGNKAEKTRTVIVKDEAVVDTVPPVIILLGSDTVFMKTGNSYEDAGATAYDNVNGDLTSDIIKSGSVDTARAGIYTIEYSVSDEAGNEAGTFRTVVMEQDSAGTGDQPPVITLKGENPDTVIKGDSWSEPGWIVDDEENLENDVMVEGDVNTSTAGKYTLTYSVSDSSGNSDQKIRTVVVVSGTGPDEDYPPELTLKGNDPDTVIEGNQWTEPGWTVEDEENLDSQVVVSGNVNISAAGEYIITYTVTDSSGNSDRQERVVIVVKEGTVPADSVEQIDEPNSVITVTAGEDKGISIPGGYTTFQVNKEIHGSDVKVKVEGSPVFADPPNEWGGQFAVSDTDGDGRITVWIRVAQTQGITVNWW